MSQQASNAVLLLAVLAAVIWVVWVWTMKGDD